MLAELHINISIIYLSYSKRIEQISHSAKLDSHEHGQFPHDKTGTAKQQVKGIFNRSCWIQWPFIQKKKVDLKNFSQYAEE
jgi:hypothetical protein